jgi:hypothetical protein
VRVRGQPHRMARAGVSIAARWDVGEEGLGPSAKRYVKEQKI